MKNVLLWMIVFSFSLTQCSEKKIATNQVSKIEMDFNSFGVESDNYPNIHAFINLATDSSICKMSYYNPKYKDSIYSLSEIEVLQVNNIIKNTDWEKLKSKYSVSQSDQPTSTLTIYTGTRKIKIEDYGLMGEYPLQELYKIVYKFQEY